MLQRPMFDRQLYHLGAVLVVLRGVRLQGATAAGKEWTSQTACAHQYLRPTAIDMMCITVRFRGCKESTPSSHDLQQFLRMVSGDVH